MKAPSQKEILAFMQGMEHAARIAFQTGSGATGALAIRREAVTLNLLNERKQSYGRNG
jgi:hypothetical protein